MGVYFMATSFSRARLSLLAVGVSLAIAACGSDDGPADTRQPGEDQNPPASSPGTPPGSSTPDDDAAPGDPGTPIGENTPPSISGTPQAVVVQGTQYAFEPDAHDADGDILHFDILNPPAWATFEPTTGRLEGTPSEEHLGLYDDIVIAVTDGAADATLGPFSITVTATAAGAAELSWEAPTENEDGSQLTDLAGYKVYWGTQPDEFVNSVTIDNPAVLSYVLEDLAPATYYFVATAVNSEGSESDPSDMATLTIS